MANAELKTQKNRASVRAFLGGIEDPARRRDCREVLQMMREVTGERPAMWGDTIVGFGSYHYKYASGREGDWFVMGLSSRKNGLTIYLMCDLSTAAPLLARLGPHKTGKSCLYLKRLGDVDPDVLRKLMEEALAAVKGC